MSCQTPVAFAPVPVQGEHGGEGAFAIWYGELAAKTSLTVVALKGRCIQRVAFVLFRFTQLEVERYLVDRVSWLLTLHEFKQPRACLLSAKHGFLLVGGGERAGRIARARGHVVPAADHGSG